MDEDITDATELESTEGVDVGLCGKVRCAWASLIVGLLLLVGAVLLLGWNERSLLCSQKDALYARSVAKPVPCGSAGSSEGSAAYFSCALNPRSFKTFTPATFNENMELEGLGEAVQFEAVAGAQQVSVWQCLEHRRREEGVESCSYTPGWSTTLVSFSSYSTSFQAVAAREEQCPGFFRPDVNFTWPINLARSRISVTAPQVATDSITIQTSLMEGLSSGKQEVVPLMAFVPRFASLASLKPPPAMGVPVLTVKNAAVDPEENALVTCQPSQLTYGCLKVQYFRGVVQTVSAITSIQPGGNTAAIETPGSWGCKPGKFEVLLPGSASMQDLIGSRLRGNRARTWLLRAAGFLWAWLAIFCILRSMFTVVALLGDLLGDVPGVGRCDRPLPWGACKGPAVGGLCAVSCGLGLATAFGVVGVVWVPLRPLHGLVLLFAGLLLSCGCLGLARGCPDNRGKLAVSTDFKVPFQA